MTVEQHLQTHIGQLVIQIAMLKAELDTLRDELRAKLKDKESEGK